MLTKESSGLAVQVDERGRPRLLFNGVKLPAVVRFEHVYDRNEHDSSGVIKIEILSRFVTFEGNNT